MSTASQSPSPQFPPPSATTWLGHPPGLFLLFLVEMWERFSYYGMRALLVLYLIGVTAVHQLKPGVHTNELRFAEVTKSVGGGGTQETFSTSRIFHVVVGENNAPPASAPSTTTGTPRLSIQRLRSEPIPEKPGEVRWVPDPSDSAGPIALKGSSGGNPDRKTRGFDNVETRFRISNPGDEPVDFQAEISRPQAESRTFFTINDNTGTLSATIKPDKLRAGPEDKPFDLVVKVNTHDSGRNWLSSDAAVLYGWYTGLAYLFPILGGLIADKLIGTHRSMLVGGALISIGHIILGLSGVGELAQNRFGMSLFFMGLAVIVLGTGHFKPTVSVMVGQLYPRGDPRRDGAFTIFYMGINLGAFLCAFVCGTLGETVGWHWGFASAAGGMILGLLLYLFGRPAFLAGIGEAPSPKANSTSLLSFVLSLAVAAGFAALYHAGGLAALGDLMASIKENTILTWSLIIGLLAVLLAWVGWFVAINPPEDRGPVVTIFVFMLFNAFFWIAFEQAGSSFNVFTQQNTDRSMVVPEWMASFAMSRAIVPSLITAAIGLVLTVWSVLSVVKSNRGAAYKAATAWILGAFIGIAVLAVGVLKPLGYMEWLARLDEVPATWFQSVNAGLIFLLAPLFAGLWTGLGRRNLNPSQPVKISLGLIFLGIGYLFMVQAGRIVFQDASKAGMFFILATYFWHTVGELCLSPTGLSYVTKAAPAKFVSLLMGIWFISSFIANLGGGLVASFVEAIEKGETQTIFQRMGINFGGQADFFFLFVALSIIPGLLILVLSPLLKKLMRPGT